MGFKRKRTRIEAAPLESLRAPDIERRIIDGVRRYSTHEENWANADRNTPFLGRIIGMGIESSNLADITLSIERQFLTRLTKCVELHDGEVGLAAGDIGPLRILSGQDATMSTPGLAIRVLSQLGHMPPDEEYQVDVISFAYIVAIGEAYRLEERIRGEADSGASDNLATLAELGRETAALLADPIALAERRRETAQRLQAQHDKLNESADRVRQEMEIASGNGDPERLARLQSEQAEINTRLRLEAQQLRVAVEAAVGLEEPSPVERQAVETIRAKLLQSVGAVEPVAG